MFLKSEINLWLRESKMKSSYELEKMQRNLFSQKRSKILMY